MKKLLAAMCFAILLIGCGAEKEVAKPQGLHYNEESGGYCGDGVCYPPWMTKEECEEAERKRKSK